MILTAYFDESGTHGGSPLTVLAGFAGYADGWVDFEIEWKKVLKKHKITHVRAKELYHRQGQHKNWSDRQVSECFSDLLYVIQEKRGYIFACKTVLSEDDYKRFYLLDGHQRRERLDTRYALCFRSFLNFYAQAHHCRHMLEGAVNFILELGHRNAPDAMRVFNEVKGDETLPWRSAIGSISFDEKRSYAALQASDMLAYWTYKTRRGHMGGNHTSYFEAELQKSGLSIVENVISPEDLMNMRKNFLRKNKLDILNRAKVGNATNMVGPRSYHLPGIIPPEYFN